MAANNRDWDDLGKSIQDIVDQAVNSQDYRRLSQTIRQTVSRAVDLGGSAVNKALDRAAQGLNVQPAARKHPPERKLPALYAGTGGKTAAGILKILGGSVLGLVTLAMFLTSGAVSLFLRPVGKVLLTVALLFFGGGAWLLVSGVRTLGLVSRFRVYCRALGGKTHCALEQLAWAVGKSVPFVRRDLKKMIRGGLFLEGHLDREETTLVTSHETYRYMEQSRLQMEEDRRRQETADREREAVLNRNPKVGQLLERGSDFLAKIRACNDRIPGEEISGKIHRMEHIVQMIFDRVEDHPESVPDLNKMMEYYLPMTVKLLEAYADMDAQPVQGQTILNSKREIQQTLDTLNQAFEKLLDDLFQDTALDVSSDISVLNTLLAQEGLTEDGLTQLKNRRP